MQTANQRTLGEPSQHGDTRRAWAVVLAIAAVCLLLGLGGDAARGWGRYEREALEIGQHWRLLTGHLVHLGWGHLAMNVAALLLLGALFHDVLGPLEWLGGTLAAVAAIDLGLYFWEAQIGWYVGLSGILHGLLALGALRLLRRRPPFGAALLMVLAVKLLFEQWAGALPWSTVGTGGPVVVAAHLYGTAGGVLAAAAGALFRRLRGRPL